MTTETKRPPQKTEASASHSTLLASLAHFSILTVIIIGPFSMAVPLIIWLLERNKPEKSTFTEFQAKQAFFYQAAVYVIATVLGICVGILAIILIGVLLIPVLVLFGLAAVIYGVYAGFQVSQGKNFRYIYVADFMEAGVKKA